MDKVKTNNFYWLYLIGIFLILATPLLSFPPTFHPAAWAKSIIFRIIFSVLIFLFIWEILGKKDRLVVFWQKIRQGPATLSFWLLAALFGIFSLATIFSLNPYFSFWGSPYRGGGFLTYGFCIIFVIFLLVILKKKDWQRVLDFTLFIGSLTSIIAIFQKFGLLSKYMLAYGERTVSTIGGPIFFALYLVLLIFLSFAFGIATKGKKKIFYLSCFVLMFIGILLAATRAAFLGLAVGFLFFIFFFPIRNIFDKKHYKKIAWVKVLAGAFLVLGILGSFWLKGQSQLVQDLKENKIFGFAFERTWEIYEESSITEYIARSRGGGWKVLFESVKERPLLGYGPENLSIAFDKYYDSALPGITAGPGAVGKWWDRGHSFVFDISVSAGIPALIIYLLLFGALFWQLQKIKNPHKSAEISINPRSKIIAHGLQATFIGYLTANLFSFDLTATYLISFFLIGYSFHLISSNQKDNEEINVIQRNNQRKISSFSELKPWKYVFLFMLFCPLVWFVWSANIKPLQINKGVNQVVFALNTVKNTKAKGDIDLAKQYYLKLLQKMEELRSQHTFIDNYLRLQYIDVITLGASEIIPEKKLELSKKAVEILEECVELRPNYTRTWLYLAVFTNRIIESDPNLTPDQKEELNQKINSWLEKTHQLSPKRPDVFVAWAKNDLINEKYQEAENKADQCLEIVPEHGDCLWAKFLALTGLNKIEEASIYAEKATENGYKTEAKNALHQLVKVHSNLAKSTDDVKYYEILAGLYQKLIKIDIRESKKNKRPENFQYHASLAYVYKVVGEYDKAREEAMIVLELSPESKASVEAFLESLPK